MDNFVDTDSFIIIDDKIYFIKNKIVSKSVFLKRLGVDKTKYIGNVFIRFYDIFFTDSQNLYIEYKKYYRKEFISFGEFLEKKHNFTFDEVELFLKKSLFYKNFKKVPENIHDNLLNDEEISKYIWGILEVKNEN